MDLQRDLVIDISSSSASLLSMLVGAEQRRGHRCEMLLAERFIQVQSTCCDAVLPSGCSFCLPEVRSWTQGFLEAVRGELCCVAALMGL